MQKKGNILLGKLLQNKKMKKEIKKMRKNLSLVLILVLAISMFAGCAPTAVETPVETPATTEEAVAPAPEVAPLKVALVLSGPINDNGWNSVAYEGLKAAEKDLGVEVAYQESVPTSDQEEAFRNFATNGYNVVIGHGYQFVDTAAVVGPDFPEVNFIVTSTNIAAEPNITAVELSNVEAGYYAGILAGLFTKTNHVAFLGGEEIPPITNASDGFIAGVAAINKNIKAESTMIGSWDDVAKAKGLATAFIKAGADIVIGDANQAGLGVIDAAKTEGVYALGFSNDQSVVAPETVIASTKYDFSIAIKYVIELAQKGELEPIAYSLGAKEGAAGIIWNETMKPDLDAELVAKADAIVADAAAGKIDFSGIAKQ